MKKLYIIPLLLLTASCHFRGQDASLDSLPAFDILLLDSTTILHSNQIPIGSRTLFLYFRTDCPYCKAETKAILQNIDSLKTVQLYFLSYMSIPDIKQFTNEFHLGAYRNITVGKDYNNRFSQIFRPKVVPYLAIYNNQNKLIKIYKGGSSIKEIEAALHS
jgi:hypothetical protein